MSESTFFYPKIDAKVLESIDLIRQLSQEHPSYWLESPYSSAVERKIKEWFGGRAKASDVKGPNTPDPDKSPWEFLYQESRDLYDELKNSKPNAADAAETMSFFRTATSLLEKLIGLQERSMNLKQISEFHHAVLDAMENVLSPTQRNGVMETLENIIKGA